MQSDKYEHQSEKEYWCEMHGYVHYSCSRCGAKYYSDSGPDCCNRDGDEEGSNWEPDTLANLGMSEDDFR